MSALQIIVYIFSFLLLLVGLMLSGSGSTGGIAQLSGQDLELFKKTKDYGITKILKMIMFLLTIIFLMLCLMLSKETKA